MPDESWLETRGYQTDVAYDGISGDEYACLGIYDLIIIDVRMPGMNGYQLAAKIRARKDSVPILMLTAKSDTDESETKI